MNQEDALTYILKWHRSGAGGKSGHSNYGYDIYLPNVIRAYLAEQGPVQFDSPAEYQGMQKFFPIFVDAAWELCRRGIVRPGVKNRGQQSTDDGSAGAGYSVTAFGQQWLKDEKEDVFVPTEPGRFAEMMKPYGARFGGGFYFRSQEAIRCYGAHAYLACCAMCGAATESILLAIAVKKIGNEDEVLKIYSGASGRGRLGARIIDKADSRIKRQFEGFTDLLKYWRDEAAHGKASSISDNEAYTSIAMLLRYAMFVESEWENLTSS